MIDWDECPTPWIIARLAIPSYNKDDLYSRNLEHKGATWQTKLLSQAQNLLLKNLL
jgi:hypothetical protein